MKAKLTLLSWRPAVLLLLAFSLLACSLSVPQTAAPSPGLPAGTATLPAGLPSPPPSPGASPSPARSADETPAPAATPAPGAIRTCAPVLSPPTPLESSGDPYYPSLGNAGYDTRHYTLDLVVDPGTDTLQASARIEAAASQDLTSFSLDLHGFTIQALQVDGSDAAYQRKGDKLLITPARPLKNGAGFTVKITYQGSPGDIKSLAMDMRVGWLHSKTQITAFGEPDGAQAWYPVNNHPCDKATYTLQITVPKPYLAASNGLLVEEKDTGSGTRFHWENRSPTASYLVTLVIGDFVLQTQADPDGLPIRNYFPRDMLDQAGKIFGDTPEMIAYYTSLFGSYPFEAYGVAVVNTDLQDSALETQTLSIFDQRMLDDPNFAILAAAHELAHQWFGNSVTLDNWQDIWLNEGFASYAEVLWLEHSQGPLSAQSYLKNMYRILGSSGRATPPAPGSPPAGDLFNVSVYYRGALTLHALRRQVGDAVFFNILKTYASRFRYGSASTPDFIALAEELSGAKLANFFQAWLYEPTLPPMP